MKKPTCVICLRAAQTLVVGLALTLAQNSQAGITSLSYRESTSAFQLSVFGDAVDSIATSTFTFGSDWQVNLTVQEVDGPVDELTFLATARHIADSPPPAETFVFGNETLRGDDPRGPSFFVTWLPHNTSGILFDVPYDFYGGGYSFSVPTGTNQIGAWSLGLNAEHVPEPSTFTLAAIALACLGCAHHRKLN